MSSPDDILEGLPSPSSLDDEPANLRSNIRDELADHLECALRRELRTHDDPAEARNSALIRFGNPRQIARRLWLDAMKGQLMNQRIMIGSQIVMILVIAVLCITFLVTLRQNQRMQEALLARIEAIGARPAAGVDPATAASFDWPRFRVNVVDANGKGMANVPVTLMGEPYNAGEKLSVDAKTDGDGLATIGPMRAGGYSLRIVHKAGTERAVYSRTVAIPPGPDQPTLRVEWTEPQPKPVNVPISISMPAFDEAVKWVAVFEISSYTGPVSNPKGQWRWPSKIVAIDMAGRIGLLDMDEYELENRHPINARDLERVVWTDHVALDSSRHHRIGRSYLYCAATKRSGEVEYLSMSDLSLPFDRSIDEQVLSARPLVLQPDMNDQSVDAIVQNLRMRSRASPNRP